MLLSDLTSGISVKQILGAADAEIKGISCASSEVKSGYLFAAMPGLKTDGHLFIKEAIKKGAAAILCEKLIPLNHEIKTRSTLIQVENSRRSFAQLACRYYGHPSESMGVIGVTGTNGKTTTSFLIRNLMEFQGATGLIGTVENWIGHRKQVSTHTTPESSDLQFLFHQMKVQGVQNVVMEVSSHSLALDRVWGTSFDTAVFTNLSRDHLEFHQTMDRYFEAKSKLFRDLLDPVSKNKRPLALINIDDPSGDQLKRISSAAVWTYGLSPGADLQGVHLQLTSSGSSFQMKTPAGTLKIQSPLLGAFNVYNMLAAAGAAIHHSIPLNVIEEKLCQPIVVPGRLEKVPGNYPFAVFVDYAHTEDALLKILTTLREIKQGRIILVFGCGGDRDKGKRPKMGQVAGRLSDRVILTSDNPRTEDPVVILKEIEEGLLSIGEQRMGEYRVIENRKKAIETAIREARPHDLVLIAGKGHENYQIIGKTNFEFNDRKVAKEALQDLFGY